ncbi:MAG: PQQ-binding-like beta-propeller repeat protein [Spirochaetota bacterium]
MRSVIILIIGMLILGCSAKKEEAVVLAVTGDVTVSLAGVKATPVSQGETLPAHAMLRTGTGSTADILIGRSHIRITENAACSIDSLHGVKSPATKISLAKGALFAKVGKLMKDESVVVETPVIIAAVRGTEFAVAAGGIRDSVLVREGSVAVRMNLPLTMDALKKLPPEARTLAGNEVVVAASYSVTVEAATMKNAAMQLEGMAKTNARIDTAIITAVKNDMKPEPLSRESVRVLKEFDGMNDAAPLEESTGTNISQKAGRAEDTGKGDVLWKTTLPSAIKSDIIRSGDDIICAASDGTVRCIGNTGGRKWEFSIPRGISGSPAAADNCVLIGGNDGILYALANGTGAVRWKKEIGTIMYARPAVSASKAFAGSSDGLLTALSLADGKTLWQYTVLGGIYSTPAIEGDSVYFGAEDGHLYCLSAADGTLRWKFKTGARILRSSPVIARGTIHIGSTDGALYAVSIDGTLRWKYQTGAKILASPAVSGDTAFAVSTDGNMYAVRSGDGTLLWKYPLGVKPEATPVIIDERIYVPGDALVVLRMNGSAAWKKSLGRISSMPAFGRGSVFVATESGDIISLSR